MSDQVKLFLYIVYNSLSIDYILECFFLILLCVPLAEDFNVE